MTDPSFLTAALLYSPVSRDPALISLLDRIKGDPLLSKKIRLISTESSHVRDLLRSNESCVNVKKWPVFAVKNVKDRIPTLYGMSSYEEVFKLFQTSPSVKKFSPPRNIQTIPLVEEEKILSSPPPKKFVPPVRTPLAPVRVDSPIVSRHRRTETVVWNSNSFSQDINEISVSEGTAIHFQSDDNMVHDVTLADSSWKAIRRLIPRQKNIDQELVITDQLLKGRCHLISSLPQDRQIRLILTLLDPVDEIIDGISEADSSRSRLVKDRNKYSPDERSYYSEEKSAPESLKTNSVVVRVRVPSLEFPSEKEVPPMKNCAPPMTTFAQRQLTKLQ